MSDSLLLLVFCFLSDKSGWAEWGVILKLCILNPSKTSLPWTWHCTSWSVYFWLMKGNEWCSGLTKFAKECTMSCSHVFLGDKVLYCKAYSYQSVHTWVYTTNCCICLVSGYFYRIMQQWGFQKQSHVDLLQALFIPARGFSRSYRLTNAWFSSEETAPWTGTNYPGI